MSSDKTQQTVPVIIKGGAKTMSLPIEIIVYGESFQITQPLQPGSDDWIQSQSDSPIGYIESVVLGNSQQFCQTAGMKHPITLTFKDSDSNNIFKIAEVEISGSDNFNLLAAVEYSGSFFHADGGNWNNSTFDPSDIEIYLVEVTDVNNTPVCQLVRGNSQEDFILNLEAPV